MSQDNDQKNPPAPNPPLIYNFDNVDPIPARVTTEGYEPSHEELQRILNEQKK